MLALFACLMAATFLRYPELSTVSARDRLLPIQFGLRPKWKGLNASQR